MNAHLRKEVRLLLPTWIAALGLVLLPALLSPLVDLPQFNLLLGGGAVLAFVLALGTFGREFAHGTFAGMMALPVNRHRLWWTKVAVLAASLVALYGVWWASFAFCARRWPSLWNMASDLDLTPLSSGLFLLAVFSGGLWTTLLLRQVAAAIWFALLLPLMLIAVTAAITERFTGEPQPRNLALGAVILVYGMAGFWLARRLFLKAEDAHWTGGTLTLPGWMTGGWARGGNNQRTRRPLRALWVKELTLHRPLLLVSAGLALLHLGILALSNAALDPRKHPIADIVTHTFWALWLLVPFLISAASIAEERKLGVMEGQLCQPVGWKHQWRVKFLTTAALGFFLGTVPPSVLEDLSRLPNFFANPNLNVSPALSGGWQGPALTLAALSGIAMLAGLFASSLARNTFQALGIGTVTCLVGGFLLSVLEYPENYFGGALWRGNLGLILGWLGTISVGLFLARSNFRRPQVTQREWIRSLSILGVTAAATVVSAAAIYHRAWEWIQSSDPIHGPARLARSNPIQIQAEVFPATLGPNGELRTFRPRFKPATGTFLDRLSAGTVMWTRHSHGSNWMSVANDYWDTAAIRADGTLWGSDRPYPSSIRLTDTPAPAAPLTQIGTDTDWIQAVVNPRLARARLLLKSNGTVWHWAFNSKESERMQFHQIPLRSAAMKPITQISNVLSLTVASPNVYATRGDGTVWLIQPVSKTSLSRATSPAEPDLSERPFEIIRGNDIRWRSLSGNNNSYELGIQEDGTLWANGRLPWNRRDNLEQLFPESDWKAVAGTHGGALALRQDGSLWKIDSRDWRNPPVLHRIGRQNDWLAVAARHTRIYALAADGSLWQWETYAYHPGWFEIGPSRIPERIGTIVD